VNGPWSWFDVTEDGDWVKDEGRPLPSSAPATAKAASFMTPAEAMESAVENVTWSGVDMVPMPGTLTIGLKQSLPFHSRSNSRVGRSVSSVYHFQLIL